MIATIIIVTGAMYWLMLESNWLRIDLMGNDQFVTVAREMLALPAPKVTTRIVDTNYSVIVTPAPETHLLLDTVHFKPSKFEALDIPETTGDVQILCRRE